MVMKLNMAQGEEANNHLEEEQWNETSINELGEREEIESEDLLSSTNINLTAQSRWSTFQSETEPTINGRTQLLQATTTTIKDQANFITDSNDTADARDWMTPASQTTTPSTLNQIASRVPTAKDALPSSIRHSTTHSMNHSSGPEPPIGSRWPSTSAVAATSYRFIELGDDDSKAEVSPNSFGSRNQRPTPSKRSRYEQSTVSNTFALPASYNSGNYLTRNQLSSASNSRAPFSNQTNRTVNTATVPASSLNFAASRVLTSAPISTFVGSTTASTSRWSSFAGDEEHSDAADSSSLKKPKLSHLSSGPITASLSSTSNHFQQTYDSHPIHDHGSGDATPNDSWMSSTHTTTNVIGQTNSTSTTNHRPSSTSQQLASSRPLILADSDSFEPSSGNRLILSRPIHPPSLPFSSLSSRPSSTTISPSLGSSRPQSSTSLRTQTDSTSASSRWAGFQDDD